MLNIVQLRMELFVNCPLKTGSGRVCNGVIAVEVDPSDTVGEVKSMIRERGGLSPEKQQLSFVGETLEDDRKLSSYKIGSNCLLEETSMWIAVRIQSSKSILLSVDGKETVSSVKARIKDKEGISRSQETILYGNRQKLENKKTLEESGVVDRSSLYLRVPGGAGPIELCVDLEFTESTRRPITFYAEPHNTVEDLKYFVYEKENIFPDEQKVIYITLPLDDWRTFSSYDIQSQSLVTVRRHQNRQTLRILTPTDKLKLEVLPSDTIFHIKTMIQDLVKIPIDQQELRFNDNKMNNMSPIAHYDIHQEDYLQLTNTTIQEKNVTLTICGRKKLTLKVSREMSVYSLKHLISSNTGVLFSAQLLIIEDRVLENNEKLKNIIKKYRRPIENEDTKFPYRSLELQLVEKTVQSYKIYVSEYKTTDFEVSSDSQVLILKEIYFGKDLIFNGKILKSDQCFSDYNVQHGHIVHAICPKALQRNRLITRILISLDGDQLQPASFDFDHRDILIVLSLKVRIWAEVPNMPPPSQQRLTHNDLPLEDSQILNDFTDRLNDSSMIEINCKVSIPQQLFVRHSDGTTITIGMHTTDKVIVLKRLIYKKIKIKPDKQQLYYNGKVMDDECAVKSYKVGTNSMLQLCKCCMFLTYRCVLSAML